MSEKAIEIQGLSKRFTLNRYAYNSLRVTLSNLFKKKNKNDHFWALKDINLVINKGETIGIIGKNGAGKSTLLKVLSKITHPTEGKVIIDGRIASLLEVGTGFHPELTGRENIYLNGVILGMSKEEVAKVEDSIIKFSGIQNFLHTPVKNYSSGMYVRLAFAVAAHLDCEILIIDEVLSVGDYEFQKKCLGFLENSVDKKNKTVIIVSHNLNQIKDLCSRALIIDQGRVVYEGDPDIVVDKYIQTQNERSSYKGDYGIVSFKGIQVEDQYLSTFCGRDVKFMFDFSNHKESVREINLWIYNNKMEELLMTSSYFFITNPINDIEKKISCVIPKLPLNKGEYQLMIEAIAFHGSNTTILSEKLVVHEDLFYPKRSLPPSGRISLLLEHTWERV